ncbi:uncharacterized protein JCM10292_002168 [Rhodotorula paludigena]|uniref:uncharacterized protein n=1 Tax=Rhodotorula paludigena TaxID=86838 RepID=UPI00317CC7B1
MRTPSDSNPRAMGLSESPEPLLSPLASLPLEAKKRIAEMCAQQDETFKVMTAALDKQYRRKRDGQETHNQLKRLTKAFTPSLRQLRQASTEWAKITAPYRFTARPFTASRANSGVRLTRLRSLSQILDASRCAEPIFRFRVGLKHSPHFSHLVLQDDASQPALQSLLTFLPALSGVKKLTITEDVIKRWSGFESLGNCYRDPSYTRESTFVWPHLQAILRRVTAIEMSFPGFDNTVALLKHGKALRSLDIDLGVLQTDKDGFVEILSAVPTLKALSVRLTPATDDLLPTSPFAYSERFPKLSSLTLHAPRVSPLLWTWTSRFASTLRHLRMHITGSPDDLEPSPEYGKLQIPRAISRFPQLRTLEVQGDPCVLAPLIAFFAPTMAPQLTSLSLDLNKDLYGSHPLLYATTDLRRALEMVVAHAECALREPRFFEFDMPTSVEDMGILRSYCADRDIRVVAAPSWTTPYPPRLAIEPDRFFYEWYHAEEDVTSEAEVHAEKVLEFAQDWFERIKKSESKGEWVTFTKAFKAVELERLARLC